MKKWLACPKFCFILSKSWLLPSSCYMIGFLVCLMTSWVLNSFKTETKVFWHQQTWFQTDHYVGQNKNKGWVRIMEYLKECLGAEVHSISQISLLKLDWCFLNHMRTQHQTSPLCLVSQYKVHIMNKQSERDKPVSQFLQPPHHGLGSFCGINFLKMIGHLFCHTSVTCTWKVNQSEITFMKYSQTEERVTCFQHHDEICIIARPFSKTVT